MHSSSTDKSAGSADFDLLTRWLACRDRSRELAQPLSDADATVQSMPDASPTKWHLAHTTWFLEEFVLKPNVPDYQAFDAMFGFLFNSYYEAVGARQPRALRGLLTRPTLQDIYDYRSHVDAILIENWQAGAFDEASVALIELGINHEEQHQELLLTDILHLFAQNPLRPSYLRQSHLSSVAHAGEPARWVEYQGGVFPFGHARRGLRI